MGIIISPPVTIFSGSRGRRGTRYLDPVEVGFTKRKAGGNTSIGKGKAKIDKIKGQTLVWNQLVKTFENANVIPSSSNSTYHFSGNGVIIESWNRYSPFRWNVGLKGRNGHKLFYRFDINKEDDGYVVSIEIGQGSGNNLWSATSTILKGIKTCNTDVSNANGDNLSVYVATSINNVSLKNFMLFDLTQMFGAGNEPSTVAEFEALYPLPYYDYNEGTLVNNAATGIETVGFNQWDEVWENGSINLDTGVDVQTSAADRQIRSKNYIQIFGGIKYYITTPPASSTANLQIWCAFYDGNKQIIDATGIPEASSTSLKGVRLGGEFTAPLNARYMRFYTQTHYGGTYNHDICINLSDTSKNGTYEAYWKNDLQLNLTTLTGKLNGQGNSVVVFPDGLKSAGTVYDEIVGNRAIKRVGEVDMGTIAWEYSSVNNNFYKAVEGLKIQKDAGLLCSKYVTVSNSAFPSSDKAIATNMNGGVVQVRDTDYSDAATFTTAMSGVYLYYELATPEEYVLDAKLPAKYKVAPGGTEERLPADTSSSVNAPFVADIAYPQPKAPEENYTVLSMGSDTVITFNDTVISY